MKLETNLAGIRLEHPLMNAAGTCKLLDGNEGVHEFSRSATAAVMVGSITIEERPGNPSPVYNMDSRKIFSLNSLGLPCRGKEYYREHLPEMVRVAHDAGKPLFVSVAGSTPDEFAELTEIAFEGGADLVEENLGCPNRWTEGKQKPVISYNLGLSQSIFMRITERVGKDARVAAKVSPFCDVTALRSLAFVLSEFPVVKVVTTTNTFPDAFAFDNEDRDQSMIFTGYAGLAGPALKPIALGNVRRLREFLPAHIQIIGVGGIMSGEDIRDYLKVGAVVVQCATAVFEETPRVFSRLLDELTESVD